MKGEFVWLFFVGLFFEKELGVHSNGRQSSQKQTNENFHDRCKRRVNLKVNAYRTQER